MTSAEIAEAVVTARLIAEWESTDPDSRDGDSMWVCVECNARVHCDPELEPTALCNLCAQDHTVTLARCVLALVERCEQWERVVSFACDVRDDFTDAELEGRATSIRMLVKAVDVAR